MSLVIHVKKGQQIIINGAVIENVSGRSISLSVKNDVSILRSKDILTPESAVTPASRVYFALQCLYLFPDRKDQHLRDFNAHLDSYRRAAPSSEPIVEAIRSSVDDGEYYTALKKAQELIDHEGKVLSNAQQRLGQELRGDPGTGESTRDGSMGAHSGSAQDEGKPGRG